MARTFHELQGPMWLHTPRGEARALGFFDYGPEDDLYWLVINQDTPHTGALSIYHNSTVRVMANESMLRGRPDNLPEKIAERKAVSDIVDAFRKKPETEGATSS